MNTMTCRAWKPLKEGDVVDIVAPASGCPSQERENVIRTVHDKLVSWRLVPRIPQHIYDQDLLCANSDEQRFTQLKNALLNTDSAAVWCIRGGYGSTRLMSSLIKLATPAHTKLFMGLSDITALHVFLQQKWHWATLHAPSARQIALDQIHADNISETKNILFGQINSLEFLNLIPLNKPATLNKTITSPIIGGNLSLIQTSIGTFWQINPQNKILFLEETNERGYQIDRMLQHFSHACLFNKVKAILLGDFLNGNEPNGESLVDPVLQRFAEQMNVPVLRCLGIGHGQVNRCLPLGIPTQLILGENTSLKIEIPTRKVAVTTAS